MSLETRAILKWYGKGRVSRSTALKSVFDTDQPGRWTLMKESKKEKKEDSKKSNGKHVSSSLRLKAILTKSSSHNYTGNFSYYARGAGKGRADKVYNKISPHIAHLYSRNRPPLVAFIHDYFKLDSVNCNFNSKSKLPAGSEDISPGSKKPYSWEAHHMIPGEAFSEMWERITGRTERIFNPRQYRLLRMSNYDINNGNNLIALPTNRMDFFQPVHDLIQHPSNHGVYTDRVVTELTKISKKLDQLTEDLEKPHAEVVIKIEEELKMLENILWRLLVKIGKAAVTAVIMRQQLALNDEDEKLLKSQTANGATQYPLKALG